jgi:hypothetical protein
MARCEHLPIYRDALNLAVHFEKIVASFSRYHTPWVVSYAMPAEQKFAPAISAYPTSL